MLPPEAAEHDSGSAGVLSKSFTQEIWASVFRQLMDQWKDGTVGSRELVYEATTPYDFVVHRSPKAESQSNTAIRELLNELRLRGDLSGEVAGLKNQLEIAQDELKEMLGQMGMLVKIVQGIAGAQALCGGGALPPLGTFVTQEDLDRQVASVNLTLGGFCQELKGEALEFGGFKFESQDACRGWCFTHMPVNAYQCFSSMFYFLCLIQ
jgi:hypothetical protein